MLPHALECESSSGLKPELADTRKAKKVVWVGLMVLVVVTVLAGSTTNIASRHDDHLGRANTQLLARNVKTDNNGWVLMARQVSGNWFPQSALTTGLLNENNPNSPAYCVLARLENYRQNGKFHFKLRWPSLNNREQEWKQSLNPFTDHTAPAGSAAVAGYETGINSPPVNWYWRGLVYNGGYSFLTSRGPWYSVGALRVWAGSIGGPVDNGAGKMVSEVELYVYGSMPPPVTTQPPQPGPEPCFPCGVMDKDLCDVSKKCIYSGNHCRCRDLQTDFVFLVDASGSVGSQGFDFEKRVVATMLFNLPANSRAGVIRFGNAATAVSKLFSGQTLDQVRASVMGMLYQPNEHTYMGEAIQMALGADYFNNPQETRTRLRMVLLTDGISNGAVNPCDLSTQIKGKAGLEVIVIGVTSQFSASAVTCLVSDPAQYIVEAKSLTLSSFGAVWNRIDNLICPGTPLVRR